jgi:hypothetical protein
LSVIRLPVLPIENPYFVYGILAKADSGGYVKFGITKNIGSRLSGIRTSCPIPIRYITVLDVGYKERALIVEKSLHNQFNERKSQGEWFKFDFSSKEDKKQFNLGCQYVFVNILGPGFWWTKISIAALDEHEKQRRAELLHSENFKNIQHRCIEEQKIKKAWRELSA